MDDCHWRRKVLKNQQVFIDVCVNRTVYIALYERQKISKSEIISFDVNYQNAFLSGLMLIFWILFFNSFCNVIMLSMKFWTSKTSLNFGSDRVCCKDENINSMMPMLYEEVSHFNWQNVDNHIFWLFHVKPFYCNYNLNFWRWLLMCCNKFLAWL